MKHLFLAVILFSVTMLYAQAPEIEWHRTLGGSSSDAALSIQLTSDNGYIVACTSNSNDGDLSKNNGDYDYWVVKLSKSGNIEWEKSLGGSSIDIVSSIQQTSDGGYIVAGSSMSDDGDVSYSYGGFDYWIVKLSNNGDIEWEKSFGGSSNDIARAIQQTSDNGYIVAGYSNSNDGDITEQHGGYDYWIIKIDAIGTLQWQKTYGGSKWDLAHSISLTADNGFIVAGESHSNDGDITNNYGYSDYWIVKLDHFGDIQWQKSLGGSGWDTPYSIHQTFDSGYIIAGKTSSVDGDIVENHGILDFWVVKLNNLGDIQWQKTFGGSEADIALSIQQTSEGGYIVAGYTLSINDDVIQNNGEQDYWIVKLDEDGNLQWQKSIGGSGYDGIESIQQCSDNGYIIAGWSNSNDGDIIGNHGGGDGWIVKLTGTVGLNETINNTIFSVYPNPATDLITIKGVSPKTELIIINTNGEIVFQTIAGSYEIPIDISGLPTGMYFVNGQKFIKK
ncbi:MAG: T9SS type A sorting domain-containing protein [Bacteroidales bacterium]|jgi:hypothetical protein|nr:T9SS type A sorting domain-containing protein [Bacteroidales bacterium]MDD3700152.1 T9SS type A sorting domain-containing protein [Bacteroidales bacterium]MDY0370164.1 T9SS type A sorting domain-containing protein [Bacteroidales bacterium]